MTASRERNLVGEMCPNFSVQGIFGDHLTRENFYGAPGLIVFFPFSFTPICDGELQALEERIREFDDVGILAVSCDPVASLKAFGEQRDFSFELASDFWPHGQMASAFGVFDNSTGHPSRSSFLLDPEGKITWTVTHPSGVGRDPDIYLLALQNQGCSSGGWA